MNHDSRLTRWLLKALYPVWKIRRVGLWSEVFFWRLWARSSDTQEQRNALMDEGLRFPVQLDPVVERIEGDTVRVLDVGAGPISSIGRRHPTKAIHLTPTDVLAEQYGKILSARGLKPPVPTVYADAETLSQQFGNDAFELVHASNCIDHMRDPAKAIDEMVKVVRPGGWIVLIHRMDEAKHQDYAGLHQWNVAVDGERFILWTPDTRIDMTQRLAPHCTTRATLVDDLVWVEINKLETRAAGG
jgi:SAM-dependent methyltransferase